MNKFMGYKIFKKEQYSSGDYSIVSYREKDLMDIMKWRNEQINILRQKRPLTEKAQKNYFKDAILSTFNQAEPPTMLFSFLKKRRCIGYGGFVYIDWEAGRAEVSFLLDTGRAKDAKKYSRDFEVFLTIMKQIAFIELKLNRLFTETYDTRPLHIAVLEQNGFAFEGRMREHVKINGKYADSLIHAILKENYV